MVCNFYHPDYTDPKRLNIALKDKGGYIAGCRLWWSKLNSIGVLPPEMQWRERVGPERKREFRVIIDRELKSHNPVISCVTYRDRSGREHVHFVVIVGKKQLTL